MSWLSNRLAIQKEAQPTANGFEWAEGEMCSVCECQAAEHLSDGCPNHQQCLNFYAFLDWEYLSLEDF